MARKDKKSLEPSSARTTVSSRPKSKEDGKENSTTVTSAPHSSPKMMQVESAPVAPVVILTPQQNAAANAISNANDSQQMHRDRRAQNENRRGRFAEKAPAGTRTKMLKIIYDKRADMLLRKKSRRRFQIIAGIIAIIIICGSFYQGAVVIREQMNPLVHQAERWWEKVVTPAAPQQTKQTAVSQSLNRNVQQQRKSTLSAAPAVKKHLNPQPSKRTKKTASRKFSH